jgi:hypothetical protein
MSAWPLWRAYLEDPAEPVPLGLCHVTDQPVQGQERGRSRPGLAHGVAKPIAFHRPQHAIDGITLPSISGTVNGSLTSAHLPAAR